MTRRGVAAPAAPVLSAILGLGMSLAPGGAGAAVARDGNVVMGTVLTITVVADQQAEAIAMARAVLDEARRWDAALTIWKEDGELARLNGRAGQGPVAVGPRLEQGLSAMRAFTRETGGAFDAAVVERPSVAKAPPPGTLRVLRLDAGRASLSAGARLDPGAIGKGLALDAMAGLLRRAGVSAAFLDFGGSSQTAVGVPPGDSAGWAVLVSGLETGESHGIVKLRDESLSTSRAGAQDTTAVLDPRTGQAVPGPRLALARASSATRADVWATALVVLGRPGLPVAASQGLEAACQDAEGVESTPAFFSGPATAGP